ncbi:MAG: ester cyclase [Gemmatimonadota bacterium]|nr:MAG: ester cyclase [Gemmatimonadota bacterium]
MMSRLICRALPTVVLVGALFSCTASSSVQEEENKAIVRRFGEAQNARDYDALDDLIAVDFVRHSQATPDVEVRSLEDFKEFLRQYAAVFPDSRVAERMVVADGDLVAFWATFTGTQ